MNNGMGRQRSHHQRQYSSSDNNSNINGNGMFLENGRWLQSAGLQHLQNNNSSSSSSSSLIPPLQDYNLYGSGGGGQALRMYGNAQSSFSRGNEFYSEPTTPPVSSRASSQRKNGEDSSNEFSPGLLDLHSFDTELLPELQVPGLYDGSSLFHPVRGRSFDDSYPYISNNKQTGRAPGLPDNNLLKSFVADKEKTSSVAKIKVVVRKRPLNKKELAKNEEDIIDTHSNSMTVHETKLKVDLTEYVERHEFVFDAVLNEEVSNDEVYHETVEPIVPIIFQRTKATCFAYGQTGSGKTYTMKPLPLKASRDILRLMHHTYRNQGFQLFVSFFEIYGGKLYDLLSDRKKLCMREDGKQQVCIVGLQEYKVSDVETIKDLIEKGSATRSTGTTGANEESSRSHAILQLAIKRSVDGNESKPPRPVGKLSFIDLAGSERGADTTDNDKQTRMEGAEINKSLLALKECIRALDNDKSHIPFRGSKLTEVLRDSFVGNSRTVMISCISPSSGSCEHTLNTLRYADRVKSLSKGNTSKKDVLSSTLNLKESTTVPLSSALPVASTFEDDANDAWPEQDERDDFDASEEDSYEQEKPIWKENGKLEPYNLSISEDKIQKPNGQTKWRDMPKSNLKNSHSDNDLNVLLQEEEDLVNAHRKQVEETMNIVREEMNLLVEADQPGNQLDDYVAKLNAILSQKAAVKWPYSSWDSFPSVFLSPLTSIEDDDEQVSWHSNRSLEYDFYRDSCPQAERIIQRVVHELYEVNSSVAPALLRLVFHDCFIEASGPFYPLYTGWRDAIHSFRDVATSELPSPNADLSETLASFASRGFDERETVSLMAPSLSCSGSPSSSSRAAEMRGSPSSLSAPSPSLKGSISSPPSSSTPSSASFEDSLLSSLEEPGMNMANEGPGVDFGRLYHRSLLQGKGILYSDQQLMAGIDTGIWVRAYASDISLFPRGFALVMMKLSNLRVLSGSKGQVPLHCSKVACENSKM
ncbi:hypothetical protein D5086_001642 [Populus alba]|uniref:Uncharacterized protein n=1 Tax=Populus alba TaxID=43335 RepID=A0ACC4CZ89_POPAL